MRAVGRAVRRMAAVLFFWLLRSFGLVHGVTMRLHLSIALSPLLLILPSCVGAPEQRAAPPASPRPRPAPTAPAAVPAPPVEWQDRAATPGSWSYAPERAGSVASFGQAGGGALLVIRCDATARKVSFARAGAAEGAMVVRTSYGAVTWPASAVAGASPSTVAARTSNDITLDQIAYSRGRFAVEVPGLSTLILPAWAEVARVIEDCRA